MGLKHVGYVDLPPHAKPGGFDHAAVHSRRGLLYVAHTANDAVDVIDCTTNTYLRSIPHLTGVAGALVSEAHNLVFTSNRGENTVGIFSPSGQEAVAKVNVGVGPNGLAYGADQRLLLAANVGDPSRRGSFTVSLVDVSTRAVIATIPVAGRTRWTVFDGESGRFYVNIGDPGVIDVFDTETLRRLESVPTERGAHTIGFDAARNTVYAFLPDTHRAAVYLDQPG